MRKLFYVWSFSHEEEDYIPVSVHNDKQAAEAALVEEKKSNKSSTVLELNWTQFTSMATTRRLGRVAEALAKMGLGLD